MSKQHPRPLKAAILLAAGRGKRFASGISSDKQHISKQFHLIDERAVITHAAIALKKYVDIIQPVGDDPLLKQALDGLDLLPPVKGGAERQDSVRAGLEALANCATPPDIVLIHDGARPYLPRPMMEALLTALEKYQAVIPALPVSDTLKKVENGVIKQTIPREGLWRAQTPQGFSFPLLYKLHHLYKESLTDDAALFEKAGYEVAVTQGSEDNIKLTIADDLKRLTQILQNQKHL